MCNFTENLNCVKCGANIVSKKNMKTILVEEKTLPEAWEKAVIKCWEKGERFPTQYDHDGDPNSRDVTATR